MGWKKEHMYSQFIEKKGGFMICWDVIVIIDMMTLMQSSLLETDHKGTTLAKKEGLL